MIHVIAANIAIDKPIYKPNLSITNLHLKYSSILYQPFYESGPGGVSGAHA